MLRALHFPIELFRVEFIPVCLLIPFLLSPRNKVSFSKSTVYRVIQKDGLNFVRLYFLNYTWYVNDLHNI